MKPNLWPCFLLTALVFARLLTPTALAQRMPREDIVKVPAIGEGLCVSNVFQTNMVVQRDKPIHVWGWADPGEQVTVEFAGQRTSAQAGEDRAWKVSLPALPARTSPLQMSIHGKEKSLVLDNLLAVTTGQWRKFHSASLATT
jgi:sialate O-acetylesterase